MLIQQIVKNQTISILDKIFDLGKKQNKDRASKDKQIQLTIEGFVSDFNEKGLIREDQKQILKILIEKHIKKWSGYQCRDQGRKNFYLSEIISILKQAKEEIVLEIASEQKKGDNKNQSFIKMQQNDSYILKKQAEQKIDDSEFLNNINNQNSNSPSLQSQGQTKKQISKLSKNLKKQFIMRNIDRIKKYATQLNQTPIEQDRIQLQQIKISTEISHKLFHLYKSVYPSGVTNKEIFDFEAKQQYKSTLNYHKILQIFNDGSLKLEIQAKLSLLRFIKKFAFNQNFIQIEEWNKIYRSIINILHVKEVALQRLVKQKEEQKKTYKFLSPNEPGKQALKPIFEHKYRARRIKTQTSISQSRFISMPNIDSYSDQQQALRIIDSKAKKSGIQLLEAVERIQEYKSYNPNEYRSRHKKLLKNVNEVIVKKLKKELKSETMVGIDKNKNPNINCVRQQADEKDKKCEYSYLRKAMSSKKIDKITWESLFSMEQQTIYHNIVIPNFAKNFQDE